jgi:hypothetical protein
MSSAPAELTAPGFPRTTSGFFTVSAGHVTVSAGFKTVFRRRPFWPFHTRDFLAAIGVSNSNLLFKIFSNFKFYFRAFVSRYKF